MSYQWMPSVSVMTYNNMNLYDFFPLLTTVQKLSQHNIFVVSMKIRNTSVNHRPTAHAVENQIKQTHLNINSTKIQKKHLFCDTKINESRFIKPNRKRLNNEKIKSFVCVKIHFGKSNGLP